jgi:hypothetical protein
MTTEHDAAPIGPRCESRQNVHSICSTCGPTRTTLQDSRPLMTSAPLSTTPSAASRG